jgi:hypothetical protein
MATLADVRAIAELLGRVSMSRAEVIFTQGYLDRELAEATAEEQAAAKRAASAGDPPPGTVSADTPGVTPQ